MDIFWAHHKTELFLGFKICILESLLKGNVSYDTLNIFEGGAKISNIFWGYAWGSLCICL